MTSSIHGREFATTQKIIFVESVLRMIDPADAITGVGQHRSQTGADRD